MTWQPFNVLNPNHRAPAYVPAIDALNVSIVDASGIHFTGSVETNAYPKDSDATGKKFNPTAALERETNLLRPLNADPSGRLRVLDESEVEMNMEFTYYSTPVAVSGLVHTLLKYDMHAQPGDMGILTEYTYNYIGDITKIEKNEVAVYP